ncbi:MAG: response regulator [Anaerolineae bacterium]|jgi:CheY-like chemotaxis protein|nr:response regulator [Anaerolineae bacterium]MBT7069992.1 response regulator [Anaerolineae bacterium]MBT7325688.1 response regulator [Anaerolineae bacterium]
MEGVSTLINSIATIMWPLIVIVILVLFRQSVQSLIESARGRKFKVKIGEMELSMDELSQQQTMMIKDLQTRVNELQRKVDGKTQKPLEEPSKIMVLEKEDIAREIKVPGEEASAPKAETNPYRSLNIDDDISAILWVDDEPKNNALLIDALHYLNISVSTAKNTKDALERFKHGSFDCVISDSCRHEGRELDNCQAGIELASLIREMDEDVPIYIYTDKVDATLKQKAHDAGATAVTSSPSELLKLLSD